MTASETNALDLIVSDIRHNFTTSATDEMSLQEYLNLCKVDPMAYASAAQRMVHAIGDSVWVDTTQDPRLSRIFGNRTIETFPSFDDFYGLEDTVVQVVNFFRHAAQGLEERKQILYLLGPVGSGKSGLVDRIEELFETVPFYALKAGNTISPVFESPLALFDQAKHAAALKEQYGIPPEALRPILSPWAVKRLKHDFNGDITKFSVIRLYPSRRQQIAIAKAEPGDENNQDMSALVGKLDIRKLEDFSQDDPDAYSYSGALCVANQGLVNFAEMFKANLRTLNPLLTATQEGNFKGTEGFATLPFGGIVIAHSNEAEWKMFRNNPRNEAFIDRLSLIKVPYCLRISEEVQIYEKLISQSALNGAVCAPGTLRMLATFSILTRITPPTASVPFSKAEIYDGKTLKDQDPTAKTLQEYKDAAGVSEGMTGMSTRFAFKVLSRTFNYDSSEIAANPVHLMYVLEQQLLHEQLPPEDEDEYIGIVKGVLAPKYMLYIQGEIQKAYLESYGEYGQNLFDRYITYADAWIQGNDFRDHDTGENYDRDALNAELEKIEKPAGVSNPKDFRNEVVNFVLRASRNNGGKNPQWTSYEKLRTVIEKKMFTNTEDLLPVISFTRKATADEQTKHDNFVSRMVERGYTDKQVRLLVDWYMRYRRHN